MTRGLSLTPCGLIIECIDADANRLLIVARPTAKTAESASCGGVSARIHSRYVRSLSDLPSQDGWSASRLGRGGFAALSRTAGKGF